MVLCSTFWSAQILRHGDQRSLWDSGQKVDTGNSNCVRVAVEPWQAFPWMPKNATVIESPSWEQSEGLGWDQCSQFMSGCEKHLQGTNQTPGSMKEFQSQCSSQTSLRSPRSISISNSLRGSSKEKREGLQAVFPWDKILIVSGSAVLESFKKILRVWVSTGKHTGLLLLDSRLPFWRTDGSSGTCWTQQPWDPGELK